MLALQVAKMLDLMKAFKTSCPPITNLPCAQYTRQVEQYMVVCLILTSLFFPSAVAQQTMHLGGHFLIFFILPGVASDSSFLSLLEGYIVSFALEPSAVTLPVLAST